MFREGEIPELGRYSSPDKSAIFLVIPNDTTMLCFQSICFIINLILSFSLGFISAVFEIKVFKEIVAS